MSLLREYREAPELDKEMQRFSIFVSGMRNMTMGSICRRDYCSILGGLVWYP